MIFNEIVSSQDVAQALIRVNEILFGALTPDGKAFIFKVVGPPNYPEQESIFDEDGPAAGLSSDATFIRLQQLLHNSTGPNGINITL